MSLTATLKALAAAGATAAMLIAVVETHEAERDRALGERRAKDAERQRAHRAKDCHAESRDVTRTACDSDGPAPHAGEPAQVVTPSSSLRSEGKEPTPPNGGVPPLKPIAAKPNGFARFWEAYPNKVGKPKAEKAYAKALKTISGPDPPGEILAGVERAKASRQWVEGYIPHPTTWLNDGRWDDQPAEIVPLRPRSAHERPHPHDKLARKEANLARAFAGADRAAGPRWEP